MNPAILIPIIVAVVAPLGAYLVASRRMSGRIATTDAAELWAESRAIREDYAKRIAVLNRRVTELEHLNADLTKLNSDLIAKLRTLERHVNGGTT